MAATGFTPVYLYASGTAGHIPLAANITNTTNGSEIALNYADGNLFFKNASNAVITTPLLQSSGSQSGWLSSTDWTTFNSKQAALVSGTNIKTVNGTSLLGSGDVGTIAVSYGGTGLTSLTAGYIPYGNGTSAFSSSANLTFNGSALSINTASAPVGSFLLVNGASGVAASVNTSLGTSGSTALQLGAYGNSTNSGTTIRAYTNHGSNSNSALAFEVNGTTEVMRLFTSTGVSIGNTTDPGATNLSVSGKVYAGTTSSLGTGELHVRGGIIGDNNSSDGNLPIEARSGTIYSSSIYNSTTAVGASVCITNVAGFLQRSTSSIKYKTDVEDLNENLSANIYKMRPVWYRSLCETDRKDWSWYGLIAEEMAEIEPRLVHWGAPDEEGNRQPEGVMYDRLTVFLLKEIQLLKAKIEALESK